jgi:prepilin-type N-terminal cleavage/methylation domain-containing protein
MNFYKLKAINLKLSRGFGLLEVLISVSILTSVMAAAVYAGRISIRNNIIANQRSQAYNLVRQNLEVIRQMRDTTWVDGISNEWNSPFSSVSFDGAKKYHLNFDSLTIELNDVEKNLDGTKFSENIVFYNNNADGKLDAELRQLAGSDYVNITNFQSILGAKSTISWFSYNKQYSVSGAINLTDWKPQI